MRPLRLLQMDSHNWISTGQGISKQEQENKIFTNKTRSFLIKNISTTWNTRQVKMREHLLALIAMLSKIATSRNKINVKKKQAKSIFLPKEKNFTVTRFLLKIRSSLEYPTQVVHKITPKSH